LFVCIGVLLAGVILEKTLSLSTCEAEYKAISRGARVLVGYHQLMEDIGFGDAQPSQNVLGQPSSYRNDAVVFK